MAIDKVKYVGQDFINDLYSNLPVNIERYIDNDLDFSDYVMKGNWDIPLSIDYDSEILKNLSVDKSEVENSKTVWSALKNLTPALACEERIWVRFTHGECLDFCRKRWPVEPIISEKRESHIKKHFFASSTTGWRDDNAISRLWWNGWIASQFSADNFSVALDVILRTADIRSNLIERPWMFRRQELSNGIINFLQNHFVSPLNSRESRFRAFSVTLNLRGAGIVFESMSEQEIQDFLSECYHISQSDFDK